MCLWVHSPQWADKQEVVCEDLSPDDPVHDGLQCLVLAALHDTFKVLRAVLQRLRHRHVQVVVGLLRRQVLLTHTQECWNFPRLHSDNKHSLNCVSFFTHNHVELGVNIHNFTCRYTSVSTVYILRVCVRVLAYHCGQRQAKPTPCGG